MTEKKIYINYFPKPPEPNPFEFKSKELYFEASNALDKLANARSEWEKMIVDNKIPSNDDIIRWANLYDEYNETLEKGLQNK